MGKGISRFNEAEDKFLPVSFQGVDTHWLASVINLECHAGLLYMLGADGKIACTVDNHLVYSKQLIMKDQLTYHKFVQIEDQHFLALATKERELLLYNLADIEKDPVRIAMGNAIISTLSENLNHSALWIGTDAGDIYKVERSDSSFISHSMNSYFPSFSKARIKILTIKETHQDILWIGTDGDGVYKFLTKPKIFYSLLEGQPDKGLLSHSIVRAVYEDINGTLYVGTRGGGLNIIDQRHHKTRTINSRTGLSNNAVLSLNKDQHDNLWIGVDGEGIDMLEAGTNKIFHFPEAFKNKNTLNFGSVYTICIDAFNEIWLGTSGYGIIHMKITKSKNGTYELVESDQLSHSTGKETSLQSNIVYSVVEEKPNTLWFGTRGGGIYRYNSLTKKIEDHIQANANTKNTLSNNDVLSLYIDKHEQLWVGTSGGLNCLLLQNKPYRIKHYTQQEGLLNNTIHGILEDSVNNLWLSTNHGLVMYNQIKNTFKAFDVNDGLHNNEFTDGATYKSNLSEKLYFGGIDGLDIVYPDKISTVNYFPRLIVTDFQLRNTTVTLRDENHILTNNIEFTDSLTLTYDQNFISFFFTTLDYWNKQKSQYAYYLENFDKDWNYIGQQQSVTLTNIPPGYYRLNIKNTNENGDLEQVS